MTLQRIKDRIDSRLNDTLCEMKPGYDDSIVGFNEAWDIVRAIMSEEMAKTECERERCAKIAEARESRVLLNRKLRAAKNTDEFDQGKVDALCEQAADEIERLRRMYAELHRAIVAETK